MFIFRALTFVLAVASLFCFAMYIGTKQPAWRHRGITIIKWTAIAALGFFGVLILERIPL